MTSFGWKRKANERVSKELSSAFEVDTKDEDDELESADVDWLTLLPNKKVIRLEDATAKSARLKQEGSLLAEQERCWEAIKKWDEAIQLTPLDETVYEMKAQVLMILCEVYPAVSMAQKAVEIKPTWWVAHQTLGRAHLGLGEVGMALKSFSRAVHLNPCDEELWQEDLNWAFTLWCRKKNAELKDNCEAVSSVQITELDENEQEVKQMKDKTVSVKSESSHDFSFKGKSQHTEQNEHRKHSLKSLPKNYVQMRDIT